MITEDGWPSCGTDRLDYSPIPGTSVVLPLQAGWPNTVMKAFAADINAYVEPLDGRSDIGGWTATNSVATSNHLGGTAMDLAWNNHPFHVVGTYSADQQGTIRELLNWYEGNIYWGGDWADPVDEMHYQMGYNTFNNPAVGDFINRKISPNGFSTFRRDDSVEAVMATNQEKLDRIYFELTNVWPSRSKYYRAAVDNPDQPIDTLVGFMLNSEGKLNDEAVERNALMGDKGAIALVKKLADAGDAESQLVYSKCPK